jgi:hypothetical protein
VKRAVAAAIGALAAVGGVLAWALSTPEPTLTAGPLACRECGITGLAFPVDAGQPFTYGLLTLRNSGNETAVLDRVVPLEPTPGLRLVGEVALPTRKNPWNITASDHGHFPPENVLRAVRPVRGYRIPPARAPSDLHEIMLGFTVPRPGRFGFRRLAVAYHVGDTRYRALFDFRFRACAPAKLHEHDCEPPMDHPDP